MPAWLQIELSVAAVLVAIGAPIVTGLIGLIVRQGRQGSRLDAVEKGLTDLDKKVDKQNDSRKADHQQLRGDLKDIRTEIRDDHRSLQKELRETLRS